MFEPDVVARLILVGFWQSGIQRRLDRLGVLKCVCIPQAISQNIDSVTIEVRKNSALISLRNPKRQQRNISLCHLVADQPVSLISLSTHLNPSRIWVSQASIQGRCHFSLGRNCRS